MLVRQETVLVMTQAFWRFLGAHCVVPGAQAQFRIKARKYSICDIFRTFAVVAAPEIGWNFQATLAVLRLLAQQSIVMACGRPGHHAGAR